MRYFHLLLFSSLLCGTLLSQPYLDYQLRLEPVWSRVADALGEYGSVESAEFSPDGKYIVSGAKYDNSVILWRTSDGSEIWRQYAAQEIERAGFSGDGKYVAACSEDYLVTVYAAADGEVLHRFRHTSGIDGLFWSHDGRYLASGEEELDDEDGTKHGYIRIFTFPEGEESKVLDFGETVQELFFSADDRYLIATGHGRVAIYEVGSWTLAGDWQPDPYVHFISGGFNPEATSVVAADNHGNVYLWDWTEDPAAKKVRSFNQFGKKIESITWHPRGEYVAFAGHDPHIFVYRTADIREYKNDRVRVAHRVWAGDHAEYVSFNADGSFLVSAHQNGLIKLWAWMGEEPDLNEKLHSKVKKKQAAEAPKQ